MTKAYEVGRKRAILGALFGGVAILLGNCVILAILYYGGSLVIAGEISVGDLSSIILYTITLTGINCYNYSSLLGKCIRNDKYHDCSLSCIRKNFLSHGRGY